MKTLHFMVIKAFLPVFILAVLFFVLILQLVDIFANLWRYLNQNVGLLEITKAALLYVPKCVSFSIPIALLFSIAFTLGTYYANNELISVFGSGISLLGLVLPLIVVGLLMSGLGFIFNEKIVIDTYRKKNNLTSELLKLLPSYSNANVTVLSENNRVIYQADYYNDTSKTLSGLLILELDADRNLVKRIDADKAVWENNAWRLQNCRIFTWNDDHTYLMQVEQFSFSQENFNERPETFRKTIRNVEELKVEEAREWIVSLKHAGLPFRGALTEYYKRFSFALTPFIVSIFSCAVGGRFKKNILLMSLLSSLVLSVIYYVVQMITILFAKLGIVPPLLGAWGAFFIILLPSFFLFRIART
ncbi:MAG: LptF/LptG family permease [Spirochaetota bacterium]